MIELRPFRNTDPPQLAEIWRSQPPQRGLMQPMSAAILERFVLSKPTFDRFGLIVAAEGDKILGFAHAGFGPAADLKWISNDIGVTSLVLLRTEVELSLGPQLLAETEKYLLSHGAKVLYGGGNFPWCPFYYGLYGGSEYSGVLDSDTRSQAIFIQAGYREERRSLVMHRELAGFRPVIDRQQMQIRRQTSLETVVDPSATDWCEAMLFEPYERTKAYLQPRDGGRPTASVNLWTLETMAGAWGVHAVGIFGLEVTPEKRRQGLATYLIGESLRQMQTQGIALAEVHVEQNNQSALCMFGNLGFTEVDRSTFYRKDVPSVVM